MRSVSLLLSILLHIGALAFVLYVPLRPAIDLTKPVYQVSLVMGAPGGENQPSPVLGHRPPEAGRQVHSVEAPKPDAKPLAAPEAPEVIKPEALEPKKEAAPEAPSPKPEPAPEPKKPEPKPEKAPDPVLAPKAPEPKQEKKKEPEPEKKPDPKPEPKPAPKPEAKAEKKPAPKPEKKAPAKPAKKQNDVLAAALADARRQANSSAAKALADLENMKRRKGVGGGGGEGDGPGGGGIYDVYVAQVILAVQPNWSMPVYSRSNMVVQVRIQLDRNGKVLDCKVEKSSGRPEFDASAVNAVVRTGTLPAPPTPAQQDLLISFNSQQMMGR